MTEQTKTKVFDIPTRLFHWVFAALFIGAFAIAKFTDDEAALYPYHMMMGMLMILAIILRLIWGLIGTKYAKLSSFKLNPIDFIGYFKNMFAGTKKPTIGRNPASSYAAIAMMAIAISLGISGYLMATATNENSAHSIKEVHEILSTLFIIIVALHIIGIIIHTISQKDPIGSAMITGTKNSIADQKGISNNHAMIGGVFIALLAGGAWALGNSYNPTDKTLNLMGQHLQLGENEGAEEGEAEEQEGKEEEEEEEEGENIEPKKLEGAKTAPNAAPNAAFVKNGETETNQKIAEEEKEKGTNRETKAEEENEKDD